MALRKHAPEARFLSSEDLDVTDQTAVRAAIRNVDVVIHLAALTDVDRCEAEPEFAHLVNAEGTQKVVTAAHKTGTRVIYTSTDYVFDGDKPGEYLEDDATNPINQYGRSKLAGEGYVLKETNNLVVRTSRVIGQGKNFVRTILSAGATQGHLNVVDDQRGRPTFADDLAAALVALVRMETSGVIHVCGDGPPCSWAELAEQALSRADISATVEHVDTDTYRREARRTIAPRPKNSVLSIEKARAARVPLADWRESLDRYLRASG